MAKTVTRKHIKMYGEESYLKSVKEAAEDLGVSQSTYILLATKEKLKGSK